MFAWTLFLLQAGVLAYAYTRLQLGALAIIEGATSKASDDGHRSIPVLLPVFVAAGLLVTYALQDFDPAAHRRPAEDPTQSADPCRLEDIALAALRRSLGTELEGLRKAQHARTDRESMSSWKPSSATPRRAWTPTSTGTSPSSANTRGSPPG